MTISTDKPLAEANKTLRSLLGDIKPNGEREFLDEAIKCFEVGALRATVVMVWLVTIDHLYEYILLKKIVDFNTALAKNTDKRIRVAAVKTKMILAIYLKASSLNSVEHLGQSLMM